MSTTEAVSESVASPPKAKATKKTAAKPKVAAAHPTYMEMASSAILALKEKGGSSRQAILKYIMANYPVNQDQKVVNSRLKVALKNGSAKGALKHAKGVGATGSFKVAEKAGKVVKKKAASRPKPAAKPKKAKTAKKVAAKPAAKPAAKAGAKKTPKKPAAKKPKTPKKAKAPAAAKKAPGSAKKAKSAKAKPAKKAAAPKKTAAKK